MWTHVRASVSVEVIECVYMFEFVWDAASSPGLCKSPLQRPALLLKLMREVLLERGERQEKERRETLCELYVRGCDKLAVC